MCWKKQGGQLLQHLFPKNPGINLKFIMHARAAPLEVVAKMRSIGEAAKPPDGGFLRVGSTPSAVLATKQQLDNFVPNLVILWF